MQADLLHFYLAFMYFDPVKSPMSQLPQFDPLDHVSFDLTNVAPELSLVHNMTRRNAYARIEQISIQVFG